MALWDAPNLNNSCNRTLVSSRTKVGTGKSTKSTSGLSRAAGNQLLWQLFVIPSADLSRAREICILKKEFMNRPGQAMKSSFTQCSALIAQPFFSPLKRPVPLFHSLRHDSRDYPIRFRKIFFGRFHDVILRDPLKYFPLAQDISPVARNRVDISQRKREPAV